ncbi:MAG: NAD-dependent deacylase [Ignavibacteria bacterium]|nr:MAG: NAD-dependent deacylase [Ignavibacteria bacterium]
MKRYEELVDKLLDAENVLFFTGAGISAESGISTFRGKDGLWNKLKPEELASFDAFMKNPDMVWEWYQYRRKIIHRAKPNAGHKSIAKFQDFFKEVNVVTQNIDNLHQRAGSENVYELHGSIERNYCVDCRREYNSPNFGFDDKVPHCTYCGGLIRPDVVWFGEVLPQNVFAAAENKASQCDVCFVVGTSAVVYPAAYIPITAKNSGAYLVEINIEETEISSMVHLNLFGKAGEVLPKIIKMLEQSKKEIEKR